MFLYLSYAMPVAAGWIAEGKSWTTKRPFRLSAYSTLFGAITVLGALVLYFIGVQPPNDNLLDYTLGLLVIMAVLWFGVARRKFPGPPIGEMIAKRQAEILAEEKAVGETRGKTVKIPPISAYKPLSKCCRYRWQAIDISIDTYGSRTCHKSPLETANPVRRFDSGPDLHHPWRAWSAASSAARLDRKARLASAHVLSLPRLGTELAPAGARSVCFNRRSCRLCPRR